MLIYLARYLVYIRNNVEANDAGFQLNLAMGLMTLLLGWYVDHT